MSSLRADVQWPGAIEPRSGESEPCREERFIHADSTNVFYFIKTKCRFTVLYLEKQNGTVHDSIYSSVGVISE